MKGRRLFIWMATVCILLFGWAGIAQGSEDGTSHGRVVMIVLDRAGLEDFEKLSLPSDLRRNAAWGLMNTNTGGARNVENTHATVGAGSRIIATGAGMDAYNSSELIQGESAAAEYFRRTGRQAGPDGVVHLGIAGVRRVSEELSYANRPGALGSALHAAGLTTAVLGNADWLGVNRRPAALVAMDEYGFVDAGDVSRNVLTIDQTFPGVLRTDYDKLWQFYKHSYKDFVVIDLGDLSRLNEGRQDVLLGVLATQRAQTLDRVSVFMGRIWKTLDPTRDLLILVAPTPPSQAIITGATLSPVMMAGSGVNGDTITSASTRRPGIVLNMDLAPTVLSNLGLPQPADMAGRPLYAMAGGGLAAVDETGRQAVLAHTIRVPVIKVYMTFQLILVAVVIIALLLRDMGLARRLRLRVMLLAVMAFPSAALLVAAVPYSSVWSAGLMLLGVTVGITAGADAMGRRNPLAGFTAIALFTVILIVTDLYLGAPLQKHSLLSYDPLGGARFYGLGNEYMGVLMGATILSAASILTHTGARRGVLPVIGLALLLILVTTAHPRLGANFGGATTAAVSFTIVFLVFAGVRFTPRTVLLGGVAALAFLGALVLFDTLRAPEQQTHIGRAARLVFGSGSGGGLQAAWDIVNRKVGMNLKLIHYTIWSRVFLASLAGLALLFYRPIGSMEAFRSRHCYLFKGLVGIVVASFVALLVNDSGVVAAATAMIFGAPPLMYYFLET